MKRKGYDSIGSPMVEMKEMMLYVIRDGVRPGKIV